MPSLQTRLSEHFVLRLGGTDRRQYNLPQPVNSANVPENYTLTHVEDPGLDHLVDEDDQVLPIFNRGARQLRHGFLRPAERRRQLGPGPRLDLVLERRSTAGGAC